MSIAQNDIIYFILTDRFFGKPNTSELQGVDKDNPRSFHGGNFDGIIEKIPYLKKLGITALWITPVYLQMYSPATSAMPYHGYWTLDFNAIDPHWYVDNGKYSQGSKQYLKDLVDELHKNGIKLILDMVVNHTGYDHPGANNLEPNPTPIRSNWFNIRGLSSNTDVIQGELAGLPDMDLDNLDVIDYHVETIASWIRETGIDAIRMDTAKHVERGFWNYFKTLIRGRYPEISLLGEVLVFKVEELTDYQKYWGFDCLFDFPVQDAMQRVFIYGEGLTEFYSPFSMGTGMFEKDNNYSNHNRLVSLIDNHDLPARFMTVALNSQQNDKHKATLITKLALTFMFTTRGIPQLYYGNEIGMEGGMDPDNRRDFQWYKFDKLYDIKEEFKYEKEIYDLTRKLIQIRKENEALYSGIFTCLYVDYFILVYLSYAFDNIIITAIHNGWGDMLHPLEINILEHSHIPNRIKSMIKNRTVNCLLTGQKVEIKNGKFNFKLEAKGALILK